MANSIDYLRLHDAYERVSQDYEYLEEEYEALKDECEEIHDALVTVFGVITIEQANAIFQEYPEIKGLL